MIDRYQVEANQRIYTVVDDLTRRYQLLATGRAVSAASGEALGDFSVKVDLAGIFIKEMDDGYFALAGTPELLFPDLATSAYAVQVTVSAPHYRSITTTLNIPVASAFPRPELTSALEYIPVRLQGRASLEVDGSPVAGSRVRILESNTLTTRTPLHFSHASGTTVRPCTFTISGPARALGAPADQFSERVVLDDITGIGPGHILRLGDEINYEFVVVSGSGTLADSLDLTSGLQRSFPDGTVVQRVTRIAGAPAVQLGQAAEIGEGLLFIDSALSGSAVEIADADPARLEYHALDALSDSQGYYRLDGVGRLHTLILYAVDSGGTVEDEQPWTILPSRPVNVVNFRLAPP